ncbi:MAG: right-handed parallel beta-helix repeat-containing protein [Candidatus Krumholzibacteria bacterium]|nr:right-handed parallel beta-helix repeat-containing protein [Candidatus Krumholzibacteria bacterium]
MATYTVSPGLNTIQTAINGANNTSGDIIELNDGTYTFSTSAMDFRSAVTGTLFAPSGSTPGLTIRSKNPGGATLNLSGCPFEAIRGGDATGVIIEDMTFLNQTGSNTILRDNADCPLTKFVFRDIVLSGQSATAFFLSAHAGTTITFENITTTATYAGDYVFWIVGTTSNLDMLIKNVDARLHTSETMVNAVYTRDCRDVRIDGLWTKDTTSYGLHIQANSANGTYDIDVSNVWVDGNTTAVPGIHVGHTSTLYPAKRIRLHGIRVNDTGAYGIEFENGAEDCELVNFRVTNAATYAVPLAEDTKNILVSDGFIDGGTAGVVIAHGQRHRILRNVIANCTYGIRINGDSAFVTDPERCTVKNNIFYGCDYIYQIMDSTYWPAFAVDHSFGPNTVYSPGSYYASVNANDKTQAEFEALFPTAIDESDNAVSGDGPSPFKYSTQQVLNILCGVADEPFLKYSTTNAANILVGNTSGNPNKFSTQQALNLLIP